MHLQLIYLTILLHYLLLVTQYLSLRSLQLIGQLALRSPLMLQLSHQLLDQALQLLMDIVVEVAV